ncbi:hypothetical protein PMAYCL1PPCAC_32183, partial [Pristionchus mayeri]
SDLPYISLITDSGPTNARRWFPCFDEPDKKVNVNACSAYDQTLSNIMKFFRSYRYISSSTRVTRFATTVPLPTYVVALAVTEQPVEELTVDGYEFRAIGRNIHETVRTSARALSKLRNHSIFEGVSFLPEKTDILEVEDFRTGAMENPGYFFLKHILIVLFFRKSYWRRGRTSS